MAETRTPIGLVDVGNSATKWTIVEKGDDTPFPDLIASLKPSIFDGTIQTGIAQAVQWSIVSVNQARLSEFISSIEQQRPQDRISIIDNSMVPLRNETRFPEQVGTDRLLAAFAATLHVPGKTKIVIDSGTAITIDVVTEENRFLGGTIMPGVRLMLNALHRGTDRLPDIPICDWVTAPNVIGTDTQSAILSGVYHAIWFGIEQVVRKQRAVYPDAIVAYTGPSLATFAAMIPNDWISAEALVFEGLLCVAIGKS